MLVAPDRTPQEKKHRDVLEELAEQNKSVEDGVASENVRNDRGRHMDIQAIREVMHALHAVSIGTHQLLYFSAMKYAKNYLEPEAANRENALNELRDIFDAMNLGTLHSEEQDDGTVRVYIEDNALTLDNTSTDKPICYFISGYIAGFLENALGTHYVVNETSCTAQGNERCTFKAQER